jgi:hypothetical protein
MKLNSMANCDKCGSTGVIEREGKTYECQCALLRRLAASMPSFIRSTIVSKEHVVHPITDNIRNSYLIDAAWSDARAIIKVAMYKNPNIHFRITSDREIRDVGVGSTSRQARGEDAVVVFNSLQDLMESPQVVIIRLGELGYKNKAAPGLLEEALSIRTDRGLSTWILNNKNRPFGPASYAYSETVWDLIITSFRRIDVPRIACPPISTLTADPIEPIQTVEESKKRNQSSEIKKSKIQPSPDDDADSESSVTSKFKFCGQGLNSKSRREND